MSVDAARRWISQAESRRRLACGAVALRRLIAEGHLTTRTLPSGAGRLMVLQSDVDALARASTTPRRQQLAG